MDSLVHSLSPDYFVKSTMATFDRKHFVTKAQAYNAYRDSPAPLIQGQTISAPHMHAKALEFMEPVLKGGASVLDIGSGSGYLTACFGKACDVYNIDHTKRGTVIGIDIFPELVSQSHKTIDRYYGFLKSYKRSFQILAGDGKYGFPKNAKGERYDGIHIGAKCEVIPVHLFHQLKKGGIMVIPLVIEPGSLRFTVVHKKVNGDIAITAKDPVRYVPLL
jgi:protein-L-isoaspartate(D-aspartate) O-methyltransferase